MAVHRDFRVKNGFLRTTAVERDFLVKNGVFWLSKMIFGLKMGCGENGHAKGLLG